jgi:hypothetical protein
MLHYGARETAAFASRSEGGLITASSRYRTAACRRLRRALAADNVEGDRQAAPRCHPHAVRLAITGGVLTVNPAHAVRGPKHVVKRGKTPVHWWRLPATTTNAEAADASPLGVLGLHSFADAAAAPTRGQEEFAPISGILSLEGRFRGAAQFARTGRHGIRPVPSGAPTRSGHPGVGASGVCSGAS